MRPVERGSRPAGAKWTHYGDARLDLCERIGWYCSYCEIPMAIGVHVEHVLPKLHFPALELDWDNFLLACGSCNSRKGHTIHPVAHRVWPHVDSSSRAFRYSPDGRVAVAPGLDASSQARAAATMSMVGLDEFPDGGRVVGGDTRWFKRVNARNIANTAAATVAANDTPETRVLIELLAIETGFWSTWMSVFADDRDMRLRLINAFAGTAGCFDVDGRATARSGGTL